MNYLDYTILAIVIIYGLWGLSKGLLKIIFDFVGYIVAFFSAKLFSPLLVSFINSSHFQSSIEDKLLNTFDSVSPGLNQSLGSITLPNNMPSLLNMEPKLQAIFDQYPKLFENLEKNISSLAGKNLLTTITEYVILIISVVILFIVVKIIYSIIVSIILSRQSQMPLALTNRILGLSFGLVISFILISFGIQLFEIYAMTSSPVLAEAIGESQYSHIFTSLPLLDWISKIV